MLNKDFKKLFIKREIQEINGKNRKNLLILISILFGTFMAIAISKGGIEYLGLKMNDPFVQNLDIEIPYSRSKDVEEIKMKLNDEEYKKAFLYDTVLSIVEYPRTFWNAKRNEFRAAKGQSIERGSPLLKQVLGKNNKIIGRDNFRDNRDCGLIVTKKFLEDFGYPLNTLLIQMQMLRRPEGEYQVPVPIIAVVNDLPGMSDFVFTPFFYKMLITNPENPFDIENYGKITLFARTSDNLVIRAVRDSIKGILVNDVILKEKAPMVDYYKNFDTYQDAYALDISFIQPETKDSLDIIYSKIMNSTKMTGYKDILSIYYLYPFPENPEATISYDKISVSFNSLTRVKFFEERLLDEQELVIEMSKVRDKENFIAISILTIAMSTMLLIFSIISVGLFIFNLLKTHLDKIKTNLGTFKAFGLSNKDLQSIYKGIVRRFYLRALMIGFITATVFDILTSRIFFPELKLLHLINLYALGAILVIWAIVEWVFNQTSRTILDNTPGDLIYGRDHI
jgi:hypothetical protein